MKRNTTKRKKIFNVIKKISIFLWAVSLFVLVYFLLGINSSKLLPNKYFMILLCSLGILDIIYLLIVVLSKKRFILMILFDIFAIVFIILEIFGLSKINYFKKFLKKNLNIEYTTDVYYYVVNKNSKYNSSKDLKDIDIYYFDEMIDEDVLRKKLPSNLNLIKEIDYSTFLYNLLNNPDYVSIIHSSDYDSLIENDENYLNNTKKIGDFEVKQEAKKAIEKEAPDVLKEPFIIYLSGIDTRSGTIPARSLSDVNMVIVVNPKTHKVLLVSVPRDYYVQIPGTTGLKDKLTHAGMIGGIDLSIKTMEDVLDVEFDYYIRVNFNAVVNLVDAVGGITINSDVNYRFDCWTDTKCTIYPGNNNVGGRCALAFARERHAYLTGDVHRAENQQQVINVLIKKLTSPGSVLSNYENILSAMSGTFETNFSEDEITSLIRYQLDKMPSWKTDNYVLTGYGDNLATYSYPNLELSVMIPNEDDIETAKAKIHAVLNEG